MVSRDIEAMNLYIHRLDCTSFSPSFSFNMSEIAHLVSFLDFPFSYVFLNQHLVDYGAVFRSSTAATLCLLIFSVELGGDDVLEDFGE